MLVWLDDSRPMPIGFDIHVKTAHEAISLLEKGSVRYISLDHDLGPDEAGTGYDVAKYLERAAYFDEIGPVRWSIHSANPVGRANMGRALDQANIYWANNGHCVPV